MSQLTKTLIVLLTISSIFLCGIVVTYVASANDYKKKNQSLNTDLQAANQKVKAAQKELDEKKSSFLAEQDRLEKQITALKNDLSNAKTELANSERDKASLLEEASKWKAITKDFYATNDKQGQLLNNTLNELERIRAEQIELKKEYDQTAQTLLEKMAIIETLETKVRQLQEEKASLVNQLTQPLLPYDQKIAPAEAVTQEKTPIAAAPIVKDLDLKGLVTAVDMKNYMAKISLGTVDGVKEGMTFHITRGDEFICDVLIISVDTEEAVGVLELVQQQPKTGDNATTNL